ncbi:NADH-quinone oxidoreductase subunit A [bacterium]|nr:NADH-quinone oxidoreductase subunit A [bacterium]
MNELFFLLMFLILATAFAVASVVAGFVCGYKSDEVDDSTYECGMKIFGSGRIQFDVKFLNFAFIFLIFDVETIFLFPFAVSMGEFDLYVLFEVILFVIVFLYSLIFAIKKKILRWQ